uniref:Uncharacterized protein n=1 Tax=Nelumbo nucifera TaxID=4432 RepID=A0A822X9Q1_NELNU|nr:TPA_asm: hypothetical protein HUJ06_019658 [Nelumbo nucifera]
MLDVAVALTVRLGYMCYLGWAHQYHDVDETGRGSFEFAASAAIIAA